MAIKFTDGINVSNKLTCIGEFPYHFDLKILLRLGNVNPIVLGKAFKKMYPLMYQPIPGLTLLNSNGVSRKTPHSR